MNTGYIHFSASYKEEGFFLSETFKSVVTVREYCEVISILMHSPNFPLKNELFPKTRVSVDH